MISSAIITAILSKEFLVLSGISIIAGLGSTVVAKSKAEGSKLGRLLFAIITLLLFGFCVKSIANMLLSIETIFFM